MGGGGVAGTGGGWRADKICGAPRTGKVGCAPTPRLWSEAASVYLISRTKPGSVARFVQARPAMRPATSRCQSRGRRCLVLALRGPRGSRPTPPGKDTWPCGDRMQGHAARMHSRNCPIFLGARFLPLPKGASPCASPALQHCKRMLTLWQFSTLLVPAQGAQHGFPQPPPPGSFLGLGGNEGCKTLHPWLAMLPSNTQDSTTQRRTYNCSIRIWWACCILHWLRLEASVVIRPSIGHYYFMAHVRQSPVPCILNITHSLTHSQTVKQEYMQLA